MDATVSRPKSDDQAVLTLLAADVAGASRVLLFQAPFAPIPTNVLADYTPAEADFTGYARQAAGPAVGPSLRADGNWQLETLSAHFAQTDTTTVNVINGAALLDTTLTRVIAYVVFPNPIQMNAVGRFIDVQFDLYANSAGNVSFET